MAAKAKGKGSSGTKAKPSRGFGAKPVLTGAAKPASIYDPATALRLSENAYELYEKQADADSEELVFREYVVSTRAKGAHMASSSAMLCDWVPCAQLGLLSAITSADGGQTVVTHALASVCKEVTTAAVSAMPSLLQRTPNSHLEYAVEPTNSWFKWVYESVVEEKSAAKASEHTMTRAEAWETFKLEVGATPGEVKRAYLKAARDLHPDALIGRDADEIAEAEVKFRRVAQAYELLGGGLGSSTSESDALVQRPPSWYESIGGKGRTEFAPVSLQGVAIGADRLGNVMDVKTGGWRAAVRAIDSDVVQLFANRNAAAARMITQTAAAAQ